MGGVAARGIAALHQSERAGGVGGNAFYSERGGHARQRVAHGRVARARFEEAARQLEPEVRAVDEAGSDEHGGG